MDKTPIIGANAPTNDKDLQAAQMKDIRMLGQKLIGAIHDFAIEKKGDVSFLVVVGASDYVIKTHKARMNALAQKRITDAEKEQSQSFIAMEALAEKEKLTITEPYSDQMPMMEPESLLSDNLK